MNSSKTSYQQIPAYITRDGSQIRELMHPDLHGAKNQSLAEATVNPGETTQLHKHLKTEEIYHITSGSGIMTLGDEQFAVHEKDTIVIAPGTQHCIYNPTDEPLHILCCCSPAYSHDDTFLIETL